MYGCDKYPNIYVSEASRVPSNSKYWCENPSAKNLLTQIFFVFFIIVSAMVMLSLFIGAVTMSMTESMESMKREDKERLKAKMKAKQMKKIEAHKLAVSSTAAVTGSSAVEHDGSNHVSNNSSNGGNGGNYHGTATERFRRRMSMPKLSVVVGLGDPDTEKIEESAKMVRLLLGAWEGVDLTDLMEDEVKEFDNPVRQMYHNISKVANRIAYDSRFVNFITIVIVIAGALVGLQTYDGFGEVTTDDGQGNVVIECKTDKCDVVMIIDAVILYIFTFEIVTKFVAEDGTPLKVLQDSWNAFDFLIVVGSWTLGGGMITMLRLLRLLRVLKLVKAFPQLQVIVQALMMGMASIGYIGVILVLVFYVFAIIGMILFSENDPWHFGTLHMSMLNLFRAATFEDWTDIMYINMYGCDQYGYSSFSDACVSPVATGALAAIYFVIFVIIGGMVLLTLFIGVVTTSMDEAQQNQEEEEAIEERIRAIKEKNKFEDVEVALYREVFNMLDLDGGGSIEEEELRIGLNAVGKNPSDDELADMLRLVDEDESGEIDLAEFMQFMINLRAGRDEYTVDEQREMNEDFRATIDIARQESMKSEKSEESSKSPVRTPVRGERKSGRKSMGAMMNLSKSPSKSSVSSHNSSSSQVAVEG